MSDALIAPTYGEAFELRRQFRQLYGSTLVPDYLFAAMAPTGAQLEAWLATDANLVAYQRLIATAAGASALCASATAMAAVVGSATALAYLRDSDTARAAMLNSKTGMNAVLANATASGALLASSAARVALYDHETAWGLLVASANGRAAISALAAEHANATTALVMPPGVAVGIRVVLVQQKITVTGPNSHAGTGADTYSTTSTAYVDRYVRVPGLGHRTTSGSGASQIRYLIC